MTLPLRRCDYASPDSSPDVRVHRQPPTIAIPQVDESAVIADVAITEEPSQQGKTVLGKDLIHKGLLGLQAFHRAAVRDSVIIQTAIHRFRVLCCLQRYVI